MKVDVFHLYLPVVYDEVEPRERHLVGQLPLAYFEVDVHSAGYNLAVGNDILHAHAREGDDVLVTVGLSRVRIKANTFPILEVEVAVDMVLTYRITGFRVSFTHKVVDCVQSTRDVDQFTCAFSGIQSELLRELLGYSAIALRLRGLGQQRQRQQATSERQRRNHRYYPPAVRYDHHACFLSLELSNRTSQISPSMSTAAKPHTPLALHLSILPSLSFQLH